MTAQIVPLRVVRTEVKPPPTLDELVERVHELAKNSENIEFDVPHFKQRLEQRGKTMRQVLETLRKGEGVSGPKLDEYGDWRIKLRKMVAGKRVQVVVAVKEKMLTAVTVI